MITFSNAAEAVNTGHFGTSRSWWWEPGDCTRYQATIVFRTQPGTDLLLVQINGGRTCVDSLVIPEPVFTWDQWDAHKWLNRYYPPGWWAGIRPLLAALGWSVDLDTQYKSSDAGDIGTIMAQ